jgi:SAM-dependent methyltransferase
MKLKEDSIQFWNQYFKDQKPLKINIDDIKVENQFDEYLKKIGDLCHNVLDIGCGMGTSLMGSMCLGSKIKKGIGFDSSKNAIDFANETVRISNIKGLTYYTADESFMAKLDNESFDGMICSNFLDVIPKDLSEKIILEIKRILKKNGYLLLKLNFFLDEQQIERLKMVNIEENTYQMNGIIRAYNLSTNGWLDRFNGFDVVSMSGFKRAEHLPEDRIIMFKKR